MSNDVDPFETVRREGTVGGAGVRAKTVKPKPAESAVALEERPEPVEIKGARLTKEMEWVMATLQDGPQNRTQVLKVSNNDKQAKFPVDVPVIVPRYLLMAAKEAYIEGHKTISRGAGQSPIKTFKGVGYNFDVETLPSEYQFTDGLQKYLADNPDAMVGFNDIL